MALIIRNMQLDIIFERSRLSGGFIDKFVHLKDLSVPLFPLAVMMQTADTRETIMITGIIILEHQTFLGSRMLAAVMLVRIIVC